MNYLFFVILNYLDHPKSSRMKNEENMNEERIVQLEKRLLDATMEATIATSTLEIVYDDLDNIDQLLTTHIDQT